MSYYYKKYHPYQSHFPIFKSEIDMDEFDQAVNGLVYKFRRKPTAKTLCEFINFYQNVLFKKEFYKDTLECPICYEQKYLFIHSCHPICISCTILYISTNFMNHNIDIKCPICRSILMNYSY